LAFKFSKSNSNLFLFILFAQVNTAAATSRNSVKEPVCKALYDFEAENEEELDFKEGEHIKLVSRLDDNWLLGELNGKQGRFPVSYVQIVN
jgi:endophilin-A